jgi:hypothetical protein
VTQAAAYAAIAKVTKNKEIVRMYAELQMWFCRRRGE